MSEPEVEWVGTSCGKHGAYTFYKGFKLTVNGETKKYLLGEFYFVRNSKDRPICIAELQLVWHDANTGNQLASARLYFRPEAIPGGRQNTHGKDELLYTDEKVVIKCRDMINLECDAKEWCYGMKAISELNLQEVCTPNNNAKEATKKYRLCKNFLKQNKTEISLKERAKIVILSFPAYCRYQSLMKKLLNGLVLSKMAIIAFGGVIKSNDSTWVMFSRDSFHHPELDKFDIFNDNKAPVLKGRPRKKRSSKASSRGQPRGKYRRKMDSIPRSDIVDRRPSPEWYSSDDNQTDTSEASSVGAQELPCPPKLVSAVKEEKVMARDMPQGVIRSHGDVKPTIIPPIPKLVKIEPKVPNGSTYGQFRPSDVKVEPLPQSNPVSICRMENNVVPKMTPSSTKASVISSTYNMLHKPLYHPINVRPQPSSGMAPRETQSRETQSRATKAHGIPVVAPQSKTTNVPVNPLQPPRASHAGTMITHRTIQPRMSAIVCTTKDDETARSLGTTLPSKPGGEQRLECGNGWKQTLKRKRGRPPGKSTKFMKVQEGKLTVNQAKPVEQTDVIIEVPIKTEPITTSQDEVKIIVENQGSPESEDVAEREFIATLKKFMKKRGSPIEKIPALGFRKINLFKMYEVTDALGGYDVVTGKRLWRRVYNEVGGAPSITSAATNSRKHYERLLLPYERYMKGQDSSIKVEPPDTPAVSQENEKVVKTQKDQNANVVPKIKNEPVSIPQSLQNKPLKPVVSVLTSQSQQNKPLKPAVSVLPQQSQQNKPLKPAVSVLTQQSQQNKPLKPAVSVLTQQSQQNKLFKPAVSVSEARIAYPPSDMNSSSVDFVTTGSRGSPIMLYSSNVDQLSRRCVSSEEAPRSSPSIRYESSRPRVITSVADREQRLRSELRSTPDVWNETRSYIAETIEDNPRIYTSQKSRKNELRPSVIDFDRNELRTSAPDFERIHEYMPRHVTVDHVNDFRPRVQESRRSNDHHLHVRTKNTTPVEVPHEPRDSHKNKVARDPGDGVLMMDMRHSPRQRDDAYISTYSLPVLTHRPHGVELYDLPNFPIRTASRIYMPSSHQVFPGSSPYPTHIIATEHGAVYPIPMPGFFSPDGLSYPVDVGVQILRG